MVLRTARLAALGTMLVTLAVAPQAGAAGAWAPTGSLAAPRADHTAALLPDGRVLVAGGHSSYAGNSPSGRTAAAELYDPATGGWSQATAMGSQRGGHTATRLTGPGCASACGNVLVRGGAAGAGAELYDPSTGAWSPAGSLATPRAFHTASLLDGPACGGGAPPAWCGKVLVAGGVPTTPPTVAIAGAELYDPATNTWTSTGSLAVARTEHTATLLADGSVLAVGGRDAESAAQPSAERFEPATGTWAPAGALLVGRTEHTATLLPNGSVLVTGGLDALANPRRSAELYDPSSAGNPWVAGNMMNNARGRASADLMPDGTLFVVGGGALSLDLASTEIYRPPTGTWTAGAQMALGRQRHTATLLTEPGCAPRCGRLLVAGGLRQNNTTLSSAELLGPAPVAQAAQAAANPRAVTDLLARAVSSRRIELSFSAPGAGNAAPAYELPVRRYVIKQSRSPISAANFDRARSLCGGVCSFAVSRPRDRIRLTVEDLTPNRLFYYAVRPLDASGRPGSLSNIASARTRRDRARPGRPGRLSARALRRARIRLRWRAPASDGRSGPPVRRYVVKQSTRPITSARRFRRARSLCRSSCRFAPRRRGSRLSLTVRRLCPGRSYYYAIRAKDEGGNFSRIARFRSVRAEGRRGVTCL